MVEAFFEKRAVQEARREEAREIHEGMEALWSDARSFIIGLDSQQIDVERPKERAVPNSKKRIGHDAPIEYFGSSMQFRIYLDLGVGFVGLQHNAQALDYLEEKDRGTIILEAPEINERIRLSRSFDFNSEERKTFGSIETYSELGLIGRWDKSVEDAISKETLRPYVDGLQQLASK